MSNIPFQSINWESIEKVESKGASGFSISQTAKFGELKIRLVEFSKGYLADHWCQKVHIVHCLEGEFITELSIGENIKLVKNQSFIVSDELSSHRSFSVNGVKMLIIDGDFLKLDN